MLWTRQVYLGPADWDSVVEVVPSGLQVAAVAVVVSRADSVSAPPERMPWSWLTEI